MTEFIITCQSELQKDGSYKVERYREFIRCKDCKHGLRLDDTNYIVCGRPFASNRETHTADWFCADGGKR